MNSLINVLKQNVKSYLAVTKFNYSSFKSSPFVCDVKPSVQYEVSKNPDEWSFVERLLAPVSVPKPENKSVYHSEWRPQSSKPDEFPYFLKRTRNHMLPVYLQTTFRGMRHITRIRNVEGDIWQLEQDIKAFLVPLSARPIRTRVNEFTGNLFVHGDYVNAIKHWLQQRHF